MTNTASANRIALQLLLDRLAFLRALAQDEITYILSGAVEEQNFYPGQFLYAQDEPVRYVYLLLEGSVEEARTSRDNAGQTHQTLKRKAGPGAKLGLYDFLYKHEHSTRARARTAGNLLAIRAAALERLIYRFPDVRASLAPLPKIERLRTIPFLAELDAIALGFVADMASDKQEYKAKQVIYTTGSPAYHVYLIDQGQVELNWPTGEMLMLGNGAALGFVARNQVTPGSIPTLDHTAMAVAATSLYALPRLALIDIIGVEPEQQGHALRRLRLQVLDRLPVLRNFTPEQRHKLSGFISHYHIPNNYLLIQQDELSDSLWVLLPGYRAKIHALDEDGQALLSTGAEGPNYFGETSLIAQLPAESTVEAEANSQWLRLHWRDFQIFAQENGRDLPRKLVLRTDATRILGSFDQRQQYTWLREDEIVDIFARRHWIVLLQKTLFGQGLLLVLLAGLFLAVRFAAPWYLWVLLGLITALMVIQFILGIIDYLNDYLIVTNRRVVRQEKVLFVNEWRQEAAVEQIQNVTTSQRFFAKLLGYGDVDIQTAAVQGGIHFNYVPDPATVKKSIFEQRDTRAGHARAEGKMVIQRMLAGRLGVSLQLPERVRLAPAAQGELGERPWWRRFLDYLQNRLKLRRTEEDRIIWRKHWIILLGQVFGPLLILGVIGLILVLDWLIELPDRLSSVFYAIKLLLVLAGLLDVAWLVWRAVDWRDDTFEVNKREIVDVTKTPFGLQETRRTARLSDITNVEVDIPTPLHYWLDYGDVRLETAGKEANLAFENVPGPREVAAEINRRIEEYRRQEQLDLARQRAQELPDWFEMYNRLDPDKQGEMRR